MPPTLTTEAPGAIAPGAEHNSRLELFAGWVRGYGWRLSHLVIPSDLTVAETERIARLLDYSARRKYGG
jgi:hypothetical protein